MRAKATTFLWIVMGLGLGIGTAGCSGPSPEITGPSMTVYASPT